MNHRHTALAVLATLAIALSACARPATPRMGMVKDADTGLMYGSAISKNLVTDASFYTNRKIKVRTRNTSGDAAFSLGAFTDDLDAAYAAKGYEPTHGDGFGLLMDVNVTYSGQAETNQAANYGLVGALMGSTYGGNTPRGQIAATVAGAGLGDIIGRFDTQDTYMVIANVTFAVLKPYAESHRHVTFSRSKKLDEPDTFDEDTKVVKREIKKAYTTQIAVFAGGRDVTQREIAEQVRRRAVRIVADFI